MPIPANKLRHIAILPLHQRDFRATSAVIANGASLSAAIDVGDAMPVAVLMPAAWTAADLTFQASIDGTNWFELIDAFGTPATAKAAASQIVVLPASETYWLRYLKIRSGTSGVPVNQGAERTLTVISR